MGHVGVKPSVPWATRWMRSFTGVWMCDLPVFPLHIRDRPSSAALTNSLELPERSYWLCHRTERWRITSRIKIPWRAVHWASKRSKVESALSPCPVFALCYLRRQHFARCAAVCVNKSDSHFFKVCVQTRGQSCAIGAAAAFYSMNATDMRLRPVQPKKRFG